MHFLFHLYWSGKRICFILYSIARILSNIFFDLEDSTKNPTMSFYLSSMLWQSYLINFMHMKCSISFFSECENPCLFIVLSKTLLLVDCGFTMFPIKCCIFTLTVLAVTKLGDTKDFRASQHGFARSAHSIHATYVDKLVPVCDSAGI